jgi:hypothetical protein
MCNNLHPHYATNKNTTGITILSNDCLILSQPFTQKVYSLIMGPSRMKKTEEGYYV